MLSERERARTRARGRAGRRASRAREADVGAHGEGLAIGGGARDGSGRGATLPPKRRASKRCAFCQDARAARDVEAKIDRSSKGVRVALERKAALYERLSSGELARRGGAILHDVFVDDNVNRRRRGRPRRRRRADLRASDSTWGHDVGRHASRARATGWEEDVEREGAGRPRAAEARRVVFDIERQTERERDAAEDAKRQRDEEDTARRAKLKAAFIRKKRWRRWGKLNSGMS